MTQRHDDTLFSVLGRFRVREIFRGDLLVGVVSAIAAGVLAHEQPTLIAATAGIAVGLLGVMIGVVLAAVGLIAAVFDSGFLRKLRAIGEDPVDYLAPYMFTGVLATGGALLALILAATPATAPDWWRVPLSAMVGLFGGWAIASNIPNLTNVLRFIRVQQEAAEVSDALPKIQPLAEGRDRHNG